MSKKGDRVTIERCDAVVEPCACIRISEMVGGSASARNCISTCWSAASKSEVHFWYESLSSSGS